ncbi:unnamed protein product [Pleuronectes platessa]|uniref:Uncharacterized protein n=1 Tax=Pleuronectes platessa TaxID=8262 RepID=A0A9N7Y899_PLEPL|nr:unnamed protein product [Pleuronectes platessa]
MSLRRLPAVKVGRTRNEATHFLARNNLFSSEQIGNAGRWDQEPGTRGQGPGTRDQGPGTRDQGPGARDQGPGTRGQGPGTRDQGPGTRDQGPGARDQGPGARDQGPGTRLSSNLVDCGKDFVWNATSYWFAP